jgi:hypothetical protein
LMGEDDRGLHGCSGPGKGGRCHGVCALWTGSVDDSEVGHRDRQPRRSPPPAVVASPPRPRCQQVPGLRPRLRLRPGPVQRDRHRRSDSDARPRYRPGGWARDFTVKFHGDRDRDFTVTVTVTVTVGFKLAIQRSKTRTRPDARTNVQSNARPKPESFLTGQKLTKSALTTFFLVLRAEEMNFKCNFLPNEGR